MKIGRFVLAVTFAAFAAASAVVDDQTQAPRQQQSDRIEIGHVSNQARAPAFSSPGERMAPNGDRVSPYPPYYHPEQSGRGHR